MQSWIIAVYECNQLYGGPEEGGWWFDQGTLVRVVRECKNEERAYAYCRRLNAKLHSRVTGPNKGRREYTSVISEGELQAQVIDSRDGVPTHIRIQKGFARTGRTHNRNAVQEG